MGCQHLEDDYELYLLGGLTGDARDNLESHQSAHCPTCLEGMREAAESVYWLLQSADPVRPRPAVKSRLMARLAEPARSAERASGARRR